MNWIDFSIPIGFDNQYEKKTYNKNMKKAQQSCVIHANVTGFRIYIYACLLKWVSKVRLIHASRAKHTCPKLYSHSLALCANLSLAATQ